MRQCQYSNFFLIGACTVYMYLQYSGCLSFHDTNGALAHTYIQSRALNSVCLSGEMWYLIKVIGFKIYFLLFLNLCFSFIFFFTSDHKA